MGFKLSIFLVLLVCIVGLFSDLMDQQDLSFIIEIGMSGSGKTTLSFLLAGYGLDTRYDNNRNQLKYVIRKEDEGKTESVMGWDDLSSQTLFPTSIFSKTNKHLVIIDTPGLEENRGVIYQLVSYHAIQQLNQLKGKRKILLFIQESFIDSTQLEEMLAMLKLDEQCSESIGLVVSKATQNMTQITRLLEQKAAELQTKQAKGAGLFSCMVALGNYFPFYIPQKKPSNQAQLLLNFTNKLKDVSRRQSPLGEFRRSYKFDKNLMAQQTLFKILLGYSKTIMQNKLFTKANSLSTSSPQYIKLKQCAALDISNPSTHLQNISNLGKIPGLKEIFISRLGVLSGWLQYVNQASQKFEVKWPSLYLRFTSLMAKQLLKQAVDRIQKGLKYQPKDPSDESVQAYLKKQFGYDVQ